MNLLEFPFSSIIKSLARGKCFLATVAGVLTFINDKGTRSIVEMRPIVTAVTPLTGATITTAADANETIVITPAGTIAALTIVLPRSSDSQLGQIKRFNSTQIVTALTVSVAGSGTVTGPALTAAAVNTPYAFQCVSLAGAGTWMRIQ